MPLEEAVRKMTSAPAARLGITDRGRLADGLKADLVVFDPATVRATATYDQPRQFPVGIPYVIVNGQVVVDDGRHTGALPGRALRRGREVCFFFFSGIPDEKEVEPGKGIKKIKKKKKNIFKLPPAELGIHPAGDPDSAAPGGHHELYLMCDDVEATVAELTAKGVKFTAPIQDRGFGLVTRFQVPGAGEIGLYQPKHPTAHDVIG